MSADVLYTMCLDLLFSLLDQLNTYTVVNSNQFQSESTAVNTEILLLRGFKLLFVLGCTKTNCIAAPLFFFIALLLIKTNAVPMEA